MLPLSAKPVTLLRYGPQTLGTDGRPLAQTPTEIDALASVQPADSTLVCDDPGYQGSLRLTLEMFTEALLADETTGRPADRVELTQHGAWNGTYLVWKVDPWPGVGPIADHWFAHVYRMQVLSPPAGVAP